MSQHLAAAVVELQKASKRLDDMYVQGNTTGTAIAAERRQIAEAYIRLAELERAAQEAAISRSPE